MTTNWGAIVLTARRVAQHIRLSKNNDAYERLYTLTDATKPSPSPPYAGRYTVTSRFWCHSFEVGTLFEGFERFVASPLQPRVLRPMGRTV
jgi:hypothetical protein